MATSIIDDKHENDRLSANLAKWITVSLLCLIFLLPIFQAAFVSTTSSSSVGRLGFILPVFLLADDQSRWLIEWLLLAALLNLIFVTVVGIGLGICAGKCENRLVRGIFHVGFWPGNVPAWLLPIMIFLLAQNFISQTGKWPVLLFWESWVGWWAAIRLARQIDLKMRTIDLSITDACEMLGGGRFQQFRLVIRPMINRDLREALQLSTAILIFDPTPALFGQVHDWPVARVVRLLREPSAGPGLYEAAAWLVLLGLMMLGFAGIINALVGRRSVEKNEMAMRQQKSRKHSHSIFSLATWAAILCNWPLMLIGGVIGLKFNELQKNFSVDLLQEMQFPLSLAAFLMGLLMTCIFFAFLLNHPKLCSGIGDSYNLLIAFLPGFIPAFAMIAIWECAITWQLGYSWLEKAGFWQLSFVASISIMALATVARRQSGFSPNSTEKASKRLMMETAITLGASPLKARRMAGLDRSSRTSISHVAALFEEIWWLAAAPAWLLVSPLLFSGVLPITMIIEDKNGIGEMHLLNAMAILLLPGLLARATQKLF